eukprot:scaffold21924_cov62-Phaeocystis_antarctica.AAC.8
MALAAWCCAEWETCACGAVLAWATSAMLRMRAPATRSPRRALANFWQTDKRGGEAEASADVFASGLKSTPGKLPTFSNPWAPLSHPEPKASLFTSSS